MSIYDFEVKTISGEIITMNAFKNKVLLIVNVASKCGFTEQYTGLENLYQKYKDKGLVILGSLQSVYESRALITPLKNKLKNQLAYRTFGCLKKLATF